MASSYGIQVYSVRDCLDKDFKGTLKMCKDIGYDAVELCGFGGMSAKDLLDYCESIGVRISGNHEYWKAILPERIDNTIRYYQELGRPNLIIPGIDLSTREKLDSFIELINWAQPKLEKEGLTFGYHNHSHEFLKTEYGAFIHKELEDKTKINFEIDTFWAYNAGEDPIAILKKFKDRIPVIHLKDGLMGGQGKALGEGTAPVKAVKELAESLGMEIVVESETQDPTGPEEITRCMNYLRSID
ncbi:MAG: sugar phosphate isomerase/epimerase [Clostridia bacterium]|nr:sugar phosphate isomerase/epimerase [Clostridia bacterium]